MKVIQVPFCFYPEKVGGTEIYVEALSKNLLQRGVEIIIAAPSENNQSYWHQQIPVRRYAISSQVSNLRELYGEGDRLGVIEFSKLLDTEKPDLVHLHAFTRGVSLSLVKEAKKRNISVIFTYHTPTVSCQRGTLLHWGNKICDGKINVNKCTSCTLQSCGLNKPSASICGCIPPLIGKIFGIRNMNGGIYTALRMTELVQLRQNTFDTFMSEVDYIVAVCNWVKNVLVTNHVPDNKITVSRQGLCCQAVSTIPNQINNDNTNHETLKIAFIGRLHPTKGIHILIEALQLDLQLTVTLDIYGISQEQEISEYQKQLLTLTQNDSRISFKPAITAEKVVNTLMNYDLLAVPSQCLETGPLVVLEAFAAKVPVIGSNLGGIAELVKHNVNGLLVEFDSVSAWSQALQYLSKNREILNKLRAGIQPPSTMETVANKMLSIYHEILQEQSTVPRNPQNSKTKENYHAHF